MTIVSNLTPERIAWATFEINISTLGVTSIEAFSVANKIIQANKFGIDDIFWASTHNKGIMNGI